MVDLLVVGLELFLFFPVLVWIIINHFGGWPLAWYRFRGIPHFGHIVFGSDRRPHAHYHKQEIVVEESPPMFECDGKKWAFGKEGSQVHTAATGAPLVYHNFDDMNPIRMLDFNNGGEIDGALIMAAWKNNAIERMHQVGRRAPIPWFLLLAVGVIAIVIVAVNIYFTRDILCAIKPQAC